MAAKLHVKSEIKFKKEKFTLLKSKITKIFCNLKVYSVQFFLHQKIEIQNIFVYVRTFGI